MDAHARLIWLYRAAGVALYTLVASQGLWLASLPAILLLARPSVGQLFLQVFSSLLPSSKGVRDTQLAEQVMLQVLCTALACVLVAASSSTALLGKEPLSLPRALSGPLLKLAGPRLHFQAARAWGHLFSWACWRGCTVHSAAAGLAGALFAAALAQGRRSTSGKQGVKLPTAR